MKLSIVILCWNDRLVVEDCLRSIYDHPPALPFETIVVDNASSDGGPDAVRRRFPQARLVETGANLGFAAGNNAGINVARGQYVLILNPDTIIHPGALDELAAFTDGHPRAGAVGCRVLNPDGSLQPSVRPLPTVRGGLLAALGLRWLGLVSKAWLADVYPAWKDTRVGPVGYHYGCCLLVRRELLLRLQGFDPQFFYHYEEVDLCKRIWDSGFEVLYCPAATITHIGGQARGRVSTRLVLETYRSRYRYFHKHFGDTAVIRLRRVNLLGSGLRWGGCQLRRLVSSSPTLAEELERHRLLFRWNRALDPVAFVHSGIEPDLGYAPLMPPPAAPPKDLAPDPQPSQDTARTP